MIRTCKNCGKSNRIPPKHLAHKGRCGQCSAPLGPLETPLPVTAAEFSAITTEVSEPVLVDFWAEWCGPCKMAGPEVEKAAQRLAGKAIVLKVDTEKHPQLAARFGISGIPNFVVLKEGRVVFQQAGLVRHQQLERWVEPYLTSSPATPPRAV